MLYSQALTGSQASAPSASSTSPTSTTTTTPHSTTPATRTSGATKQARTTTSNHTARSPPKRHHSPNPEHKPNTAAPGQAVYVLTLTTTPSLTDPLTALRRSHFPRHLDRHPAHLTLFHALPGSQLEPMTAALAELCAAQPPVRLATGVIFRMRRGVGINVVDHEGRAGGGSSSKAAARRLHSELQRRWWEFLSEQDRRPWRPHWTVQNKAADEGAVDAAIEEVRLGFRGAEGLATGCALWRYEKGGNWAFERDFHFGGEE